MNIQALKRRLLPFQGFRNEDEDDGSGLGGEVIAIDGQPNPDDEDRGDTVDFGDEPASAKPAPAKTPEQDPDDADDSSAKGGMIPKGRFNEVNVQRKEAQRLAELERERADAAEAELAEYRAGKKAAAAAPTAPAAPVVPEFDEAAKEREYADALMEGDLDKAGKVRTEINRELRRQAARDVIQQQTEAEENRQLKAISDQAVSDYPYLNTPEGADALELILTSRDQRARKGVSWPQALADAVAAIAPRFAPDDSAPPSRELQNGGPKGDTRSSQAIARGLAASAQQPPAVQAGIGNRASAAMLDVENMTDEQFQNLSEADKAKLRGDNA